MKKARNMVARLMKVGSYPKNLVTIISERYVDLSFLNYQIKYEI